MTSRIVQRFPSYGSRVTQALAWDQVMAELCLDYDAVLADLEVLEMGPVDKQPQHRLYGELVRLKAELESEVLERLASYTEDSETPGHWHSPQGKRKNEL